MKNTKPALVVVCAILLVAASIMGTLAYLTDTTQVVENTFSVGKVTITLDEAKINKDGQPINKEGTVVTDREEAERVTENAYVMIPGHTYTKDPVIRVAADSENCYLFVTIDNGIAEVEHTIADQLATIGTGRCWNPVEGYTNLYCYSWIYNENKYPQSVGAGSYPNVFRTITIDADATYEELKALQDAGAKIDINAYAVQVDGFEGRSAKEIWETAFGDKTTTAKSVTAIPET